MFTHLKINTAIAICTAFVFRLLFVNIGFLPLQNNSQVNNEVIKHFSTVLKKRKRHVESTVRSNAIDYSTLEFCEEGLDNEEDPVKENSPVILSFLHSFLKYITFIPKSNHPFDLIKCDLYPKKYLSLSILRI